MNLLAQLFGFLALFFTVIAIQFDNRGKVLKMHIVSNVFYSLQYLMLDAYAGLFISIVGMFRSIIFDKFARKDEKIPLFVLIIIVFLILYSGYLSYTGFLSILPIFNGIIYSFCLWRQDLKQFRMVSVFCAIVWLIYNLMVGAYIGSISSLIEIVLSLFTVIRIDILKRKILSK